MQYPLIFLLITIYQAHQQAELDSSVMDFSGQLYLKSALLDQAIYKNNAWADRQHRVPVSDATVFDIASVNKSFIANLVLQAIAEKRWSLSTRLNHLLKSYQFNARFNDEVTLHQMLNHISGLGDYQDLDSLYKADNYRVYKRRHFTNAEYLNFLAQQPASLPEQRFYYSNFAYHILPILLEEEYDLPFDSILQNKICEPLGMKHTHSPQSRREIYPNLATAYQLEEGVFKANDFIDLSLGRRIFSNARDLMLWLESGGGQSLLPDSLAGLILENQVSDIDSNYVYAFGWVPFKKGDDFRMGNLNLAADYIIHGGSTGGFQSILVSVNKGESNLVLLANDGNGPALFKRAQSILKDLYHEN